MSTTLVREDISSNIVERWIKSHGIRGWVSAGIRPTCNRLGCNRKARTIYLFQSKRFGSFSLSCAKHEAETTAIMMASSAPLIAEGEWRGMCPPIGGTR